MRRLEGVAGYLLVFVVAQAAILPTLLLGEMIARAQCDYGLTEEEAVLFPVQMMLCVFTGIWLWKKGTKAVLLTKLCLIAGCVLSVWRFKYSFFPSDGEPHQPFVPVGAFHFHIYDYFDAVFTVVYTIIWFWYLVTSVRVKATYDD